MRIVKHGSRGYVGQLVPGTDPADQKAKKDGIRCYGRLKGLLPLICRRACVVHTNEKDDDSHRYIINKKSAQKWIRRHEGEVGENLWESVDLVYKDTLERLHKTPNFFLDDRRDRRLHTLSIKDSDIHGHRLQVSNTRLPLIAPALTVPDCVEFEPEQFIQLAFLHLGQYSKWETDYLPRLETWARVAQDDPENGPLLGLYLAAIAACLMDDAIAPDMKESVLLNISAEASCTPGMIVRAQKEYARLHIEGPLTMILREIEDLKSDIINSIFDDGVSAEQSVHFVASSKVHFGHRLGLDVESGKKDPYHNLGGLLGWKLRYWDRSKIFKIFRKRFTPNQIITRITDGINANRNSQNQILGLDQYFDLLKELLQRRYKGFQTGSQTLLRDGPMKASVEEILNDALMAKQVSTDGTIDPAKLHEAAIVDYVTNRFFDLDDDELICGIKPAAIELILIEMGVIKRRGILFEFWKHQVS